MIYKSQIETPTNSYVSRYPWAEEFAKDQNAIYWAGEEPKVVQDKLDFLVNLNQAELHAITLAQSLLTQYELMLGGEDLWGGRIAEMFPRPEIRRMCAAFTNVELNSHAPFYKEGNVVMNNHNDDFYEQWITDPLLKGRMDFIDSCSMSDDPLVVTAALTLLEGIILFSNFGFFKSAGSRGFNFIPRFVSGIDASAKDEDYHSWGSSYIFRTCRNERMENGFHSKEDDKLLYTIINKMNEQLVNHEYEIIDMMFKIHDETNDPNNKIRFITKEDLKHFVRDRSNSVMSRLEAKPVFEGSSGIISDWFYNQISTVKQPDFFIKTDIQYRKDFDRNSLGFGL